MYWDWVESRSVHLFIKLYKKSGSSRWVPSIALHNFLRSLKWALIWHVIYLNYFIIIHSYYHYHIATLQRGLPLPEQREIDLTAVGQELQPDGQCEGTGHTRVPLVLDVERPHPSPLPPQSWWRWGLLRPPLEWGCVVPQGTGAGPSIQTGQSLLTKFSLHFWTNQRVLSLNQTPKHVLTAA